MDDPTTLAQIFSKQPPYTDEELSTVIGEYRAKRTAYLTGAKTKPAKAAKGTPVDLEDLAL